MNITEFTALKVGDHIDSPMSQSAGTVTERTTDRNGNPIVRVRWSRGAPKPGNDITFAYTVQNTSWFHWSGVDDA